ncbi:T9SS type A sorting domain-containing protein, partial [Rufibacter latericius]
GGTYYINGVEATTFNPTTPGEYWLTYRYTNPYTYCKGEAKCKIVVYPRPYVKIKECPKVCEGSYKFALTGGYPAGGTYYMKNAAGSFEPVTHFDPVKAGEYEVIYRYTDPYTYCKGEDKCVIKVYPAPTVSLKYCPKVCVGSEKFALTGGEPAGGTYYVDGVPATYFDPTTVGEYKLTYKYTDPYTYCKGEAHCYIKVVAAPTVTLKYCPKVCVGSEKFTLTGGEPAGGTYYVDGVAMTEFNPDKVGEYKLTYKYTDPYTYCKGEAHCYIKVVAAPEVTFKYCPEVCVGSDKFALTGGEPAGGTYYVDGQAMTHFDPTTPGVYKVTYKYTDPYTYCKGEAHCYIKVYEKPYVKLEAGTSYCDYYKVPTVKLTATASGGSGTGYSYVFTLPNGSTLADADGVIEVTQPGTYKVVVTDSRGCKAYDSVTPYFVPCKSYVGCTPGYWKNHLEAWYGCYDPNANFFITFGITDEQYFQGFASTLTLGEAVKLKGGGFNALSRHAVAALLNACHSGVYYQYTQGQILNAVKSAFEDGSATLGGTNYDSVEALKNELDRANNEGDCPLGNDSELEEISTVSSIADEGSRQGLQRTDINFTAHPNPFAQSATVNFTLREGGAYSLILYDLNGKVVREISSGVAEAGKAYSFTIDGEMAAGVYIARLKANKQVKVLRIMHRKDF